MLVGLQFVACAEKDRVAKVGDATIHTADVQLAARRTSASLPEVLDRLVDEELLAEGARRVGLNQKPEISARLDEASRSVLSQAYLDTKLPNDSSDARVRDYFNVHKAEFEKRRIHVAQIFIRAGATSTNRLEARARAESLVARIHNGDAFDEIAKKYSEDTASASIGGWLPAMVEGGVDPQVFTAGVLLKKGQVSPLLETKFGLHIFKALEDPGVTSSEFEQNKADALVRVRREQTAVLLADLKATITVRKYIDKL